MRRRLLVRAPDRWWLFRTDRAEIDEAVTATCRMMLAQLTAVAEGYRVQTPRETLHIDVVAKARVFTVVFRGPWRGSRKAGLIRKLLRKQFEPVIPRLRIRLQRTR